MRKALWTGVLLAWTVSGICASGCSSSKENKRPDPIPADFSLPSLAGRPALNFAPTAIKPETVLLKGATIMTVSGPTIDKGWLLLKDGQIQAVSAEPIEAPEGAKVVDVTGKFITPGIIDTHSHLGVYPTPHVAAHSDGNEATDPITPDVQAIHGVWPQDPGLYRALGGGITTLQILPGSANLVGGRTVTLKMHPGISSRSMLFFNAPWGLKMACGENPKRVYGGRGRKPSTRMGNMAVWRQTFQRAREYKKSLEQYEKEWRRWERSKTRDAAKEPQAPPRQLSLETLVAAMQGDILVHVHCYRADEMLQVLELADEFGFRVRSFHHAVEAYKIRDVLAEWEVSVSTWADWWGFKIEAHDAILENAALLETAGARAIIHSDSEIGIQRLNQEAAKAMYAGIEAGLDLKPEDALRWITLNPAWALGIDKRTGSLEVGKMADVVVWSAHPLSVYAKAEQVYVDGVQEYDHKAQKPWSDFVLEQLPGQNDAKEGAQ